MRQAYVAAVRALRALGIPPVDARVGPIAGLDPDRAPAEPVAPAAETQAAAEGVPPEWLAWCRRWRDRSGLAPRTRKGHYHNLLVTGR